MAKLLRLAEYRRSQRVITFDRHEMNLLLALYSRRVAMGEWRDYAIDLDGGMAAFSVFRHSDDRPLFTIAKCAGSPADGPGGRGYILFNGAQILRRGRDIRDVLSAFEPPLRLVGRA
ncbi:MAG: DUF2794 domain-containing protein [Alphaproteobacteria bacterium]